MSVVEVNQVSKTFPARRGARVLSGRGGLGDWIRGRKTGTVTALHDISLTVEPGESLGIIGRNGSGKSTLLSLIAGVSLPSTGSIKVHGRVASLLELGAGFHPMLTGRENVYLNAGLLGVRHAQVDEIFDSIVEFSGIGDFIDQPVDTYSSGMYVRIGFAVAVHTNPDLFLIDEVLAVGDEEFQRKCRRKIGELREQKKTIIFVSHDLGIVNSLCERVILLDKGRMLHRDTVQKTINFYLRQIGRECGVHTFEEGPLQAVSCEGRISLFHNQEEITSPDGLNMQLVSLGQRLYSASAEWEVTKAASASCTAVGQMTRIPVRFHWDMRIEDGRFHWDVSMEVQRETILDEILVITGWPIAYEQMLLGERLEPFPEITPHDLAWHIVAFPPQVMLDAQQKLSLTAAVPSEHAAVPAVLVRFNMHLPQFRCCWANSEYIMFSRLLFATGRFAETDRSFAPGRYKLISMEVSTVPGLEAARQQVRTVLANLMLIHGPYGAYFEEGHIRLSYEGRELSAFLHVYASMLIQQLWNDSHNLQWTTIQGDGRRILATGESRRFPFRQHWEIAPADDGFSLRIWLECRESFEVEEYHATAVLLPEYAQWRTDHEEGVFPPFDSTKDTWVHLNKTYAPGKQATALSSSLPSVTLEVLTDEIPFRMTAINTQAHENARVLQALRTSEMGRLLFEPGRHLYFAGRIRIAPPGA